MGLARGGNRAQLHSGADASCTDAGIIGGRLQRPVGRLPWCFLLGVTFLAGCGDREGAGNSEETSTAARPERRVAVVDFRIGGDIAAGEEYQFADVRGLALLPDDRFVVSDYMAQRVGLYAAGGRFITEIGGVGEGPGEFDRPWTVAVDPAGSVWVFVYSPGRVGFLTYTPESAGASYLGFLSPDRRPEEQRRCLSSRKPLFAADGLIGLTSCDGPLHGVRLWVDPDGIVVREDTLPRHVSGEELGARRFTFPGTPGSNWVEVLGPFAPADHLADARSGAYARCVTRRYEIDLYDERGVRFRTITREQVGPRVSRAERGREEFVVDSLRTAYQPGDYPDFTVPERKPPIRYLWYDEDGRLWVQLWEADGDSLATAHVYDHAGDFLFEAQWPLDVSLREGAIRGDAAVGVGTGAFDIPEVVRMTFRESG